MSIRTVHAESDGERNECNLKKYNGTVIAPLYNMYKKMYSPNPSSDAKLNVRLMFRVSIDPAIQINMTFVVFFAWS